MNIEERVLLAATNEKEKSSILTEYKSFIKSVASKTTGKFINESDDEFSVALIAFNEAIDRYDKDKGAFLSYASLVIKSRLTDALRTQKEMPVPFSSLKNEDEEIEVVGLTDVVSDAATEIECLKNELLNYGISFSKLTGDVPRAKKTRRAVACIIQYIMDDEQMTEKIKESGMLPVAQICAITNVHRKICERHRKYIITAIIVLSGEYDFIKPYIKGIFSDAEVRK